MALNVLIVPQLPWEPLKSFQRTSWQPRDDSDGRSCGNDPIIFFCPRLCAASMHCIPGRANQLVFRSQVWFDWQYWE
jgi:hypothetical protein